MSGEAPLAVRSFRVGKRTCTLTIPRATDGVTVLSAVAEWTPSAPSQLSSKEWRQYRAGRDQTIASIAAELGLSIALLEV